jgi:hypothetical protein
VTRRTSGFAAQQPSPGLPSRSLFAQPVQQDPQGKQADELASQGAVKRCWRGIASECGCAADVDERIFDASRKRSVFSRESFAAEIRFRILPHLINSARDAFLASRKRGHGE